MLLHYAVQKASEELKSVSLFLVLFAGR